MVALCLPHAAPRARRSGESAVRHLVLVANLLLILILPAALAAAAVLQS